MRKRKSKKNIDEGKKQKYYCSVCGREIDEDEYENYDGMCWE